MDIVERLRNPPFGTETSERSIMTKAADEIERLREALKKIRNMGQTQQPDHFFARETMREIAAAALKGDE